MKKTRTMLRIEEAYRNLLHSEDGRLVFRDIIDMSGFLKLSAQRGNGNVLGGSETFFNEGRRSIGLGLVQRLEAISPYALAALMEERARDIENERATRQQRPQPEEANADE